MTIIAAMTKDRLVGKDNGMPWYIPEDFKHFRKTTTGNVILMGRKTFESIGCKPLPQRPHVIISRSMSETEGVAVCRTLDEGLEKASSYGKEVFICGGVEIYRQTLPLANRMILSFVKADYDGDAYFPEFDEADWTIEKKEDHAEFTIVYYTRL